MNNYNRSFITLGCIITCRPNLQIITTTILIRKSTVISQERRKKRGEMERRRVGETYRKSQQEAHGFCIAETLHLSQYIHSDYILCMIKMPLCG